MTRNDGSTASRFYPTWAVVAFVLGAGITWGVYPEGGFTTIILVGLGVAVIITAAVFGLHQAADRRDDGSTESPPKAP